MAKKETGDTLELKINLQDVFLNELRKENKIVSIYLINGIKLQGCIQSFDQYVVFLKSGALTQMVYKHAVSTVSILQAVYSNKDEGDSQELRMHTWLDVT